jgi:hypothetical protein
MPRGDEARAEQLAVGEFIVGMSATSSSSADTGNAKVSTDQNTPVLSSKIPRVVGLSWLKKIHRTSAGSTTLDVHSSRTAAADGATSPTVLADRA